MTIVMSMLLLYVLGILLLLYVSTCWLYEPDVQEARIILALGCGAHISLFKISLKVGLHLIPTINVIHLAFSYLYICVVLLIASTALRSPNVNSQEPA